MAKKKKKKDAKKAVGGVQISLSREQLEAAGLVTAGGELAAGLLEAVGLGVQHAVEALVASRGAQSTPEAAGEHDTVERLVWLFRNMLQAKDSRRPYLRVIGRVAEILLHHRGFETISAGDVYLVFLAEIPGEMPEAYRQTPHPGEAFSVSTGEGRKTFNNRIRELRGFRLIEATATKGNRQEDHVLTEEGARVFDGWPELTEIPGLELQRPGNTAG